MFYSKFQEGMVPQVADPQQFQQQGEQIDPEMLNKIMSEQGYGQGVDFNGHPTPNVSGKPSFADMMQEIQQRYDAKILPLQKELEKLEEELKNNPGDQTLKNKIERIQQKIDTLEQQEDKELQQLEEEVQRSGEIVDAQKEMQGMPEGGGEQIDPEMLQQVMQEQGIPQAMPQQQMPQEMPMMQTGGITKNQTGTVLDYIPFMSDEKKKELSNRAKVIFSAMKDETLNGNGGGNPSSTTKSIMMDKKDIEDKYPLLDLALQLNPVYSGIDMGIQAKSDIENKNTASIPLWIGLSALGLLGGGAIFKKGAQKAIAKLGTEYPKLLEPIARNTDSNLLKQYIKESAKGGGQALLKTIGVPLRIAERTAVTPIYNSLEPIFRRGWRSGSTRIPYKDMYKGVTDFSKTFFPSAENYTVPQHTLGKIWNIGTNLASGALKTGTLGGSGYFLYKNFLDKDPQQYDNSTVVPDENINPVDTTTNSIDTTTNSDYEGLWQTGGILNKYSGGSYVEEPVAEPTDEQKKKAEQLEKDRQAWFNSMLDQIKENHPQGIKGYLKDAPWTQHINMGNMIGKAIDNSGRMNIEAQHQFSHNYNPYTYVYDKALREYDDQQKAVKQRYALDDIHLKRYRSQPQYRSLQQAHNARLAQQSVDNLNELQNKSNLLQSLQSINSVFGKQANDAYQKMLEQEKANALLNENERKSYLSAIDSYNKEKMALNDNVVNYLTMAGNEWANNDEFYGEYAPNYLTGLKLGIPVEVLNMILKRNSQYNANLVQSAQNTNNR